MRASSSTNPGSMERWSTRVLFFIGGFSGAAWAPIIPFAKARLGLDDGTLGLVLLCFGIGSLGTMPLSGYLASRFGLRPVLVGASLILVLMVPALGAAPNVFLLVAALLVFGCGIGAIDVVVNIQAVIVEKASGTSLMSGFHGFWSVGGLVGSGLAIALLGLGVPPLFVMITSGAVVLVLIGGFRGGLLTDRNPKSEREKFLIPPGVVLAVAALAFLTFLAEGSILDWSAVFLSSTNKMPLEWAGVGYAAFSVLMVVGRLSGDWVVNKLGRSRVMILGGLGGAGGFALAILSPWGAVSVVGYALVGISMSNVVPVLFSTLGRQKHMPPHQAVSFVSTVAYTGILLGPAFVGFVSHATNLSIAIGIVGASLLAVTASYRLARR